MKWRLVTVQGDLDLYLSLMFFLLACAVLIPFLRNMLSVPYAALENMMDAIARVHGIRLANRVPLKTHQRSEWGQHKDRCKEYSNKTLKQGFASLEEKWGFSLGLIREEDLPNVRFYRDSPFQLPIPDFYYKKEDFAKRRLVDVEASGTPTHLIKHFLGFDGETEDGPKCIQIITQEDHNRMKKLKNVLDPPDKAGQVTMADCMRWMMNLEARKANKFMPAGMTRDQLRLVREHAAQDSAVRTM